MPVTQDVFNEDGKFMRKIRNQRNREPGQHRLMHAHPLLWRLHRMHHADTEVDASTGLRFHPLEILLSTL